jgi:hypothetical protein
MTAEIKNLLEKAHISLILDSYDALFSDFDPRPYNERALSDDFLVEAKRAIREAKPGILEMRFLIPKHLNNAHEEELIKERLHHYFQQQTHRIAREARGIVRKGLLLALLGFLFMFASTYLSHEVRSMLLLDFLRVMMEPAGWFLVWYGFDQIFYNAKSLKPELDFNHKMSHAEIHFDTY